MKKIYGFYPILFTMMILLITGSASAFFTGDGKGLYGGDRQPGIKANDPFVKASTPRTDREAVPEGLTKTAWGKIRASIERDRYRLHKDDRTGTYQAPNYAHDLHATFTQEGVEVRPRKGKNGWIWGLRLSRYGYGSDLHAVTGAKKMITKDNRIAYLRGDMVEWYINDHRGLEQGFTLKARPSGRMGSGLLQLHMQTTGTLIPGVEKEGKGIVFKDAHGKEVLRYSGLYACDAKGKKLYARMSADQEGIRLIVEDHEAVYPITIDPFIERKKLLASDGAAGDRFGYSVSISGDTAIVGAYYDDDNGTDSGSAYIFSRDQGGADTWGEVKKLLASDGATEDYFGNSVSISGDTAIVGAFEDKDNGSDSGSAYIFSYVFADELAVDFGASGLYHYDSGWFFFTSSNPEDMENYNGDLAADFGSAGLYLYDGTWTFLTGTNPEDMEAVGTDLYVDFGAGRLYKYDGTWTFLTGANAEDMEAVGTDLYADFGASGLYAYDGTWTFLASSNAEDMVASGVNLYVDFGPSGIYKYDGSWTFLAGSNPEDMEAVGTDLYVDFGASGLYKYDGAWTFLQGANPEDMEAVNINP